MKLNSINQGYASNSIGFGNSKSDKQREAKIKLNNEIFEAEGTKDNLRILKIYAPALPADSKEVDTGIGYADSLQAQKLYKLAVDVFGANAVKQMPNTELTDLAGHIRENKRPPAYNRSGLTIGDDVINIPALTTDQYGCILSKEDAQELIDIHNERGREDRIDFETILAFDNQENHPVNKYLGIAYNIFLHKPDPSPKLKELRKEFEEFKKDPFYDEICSRTALFPQLKDWGTGKIPGNFFEGFDTNPSKEQIEKYEQAKKEFSGQIEFYKFKKFLAVKNEQAAVELAHNSDLRSFKDVNLGFSYPETQVFPDAFKKLSNGNIAEGGWGVPTLKYEDLLEKKDSAAHKLLSMKLENALRIHDGLRLDVGWQLIHPKYSNSDFDWSDYSHGRPDPCDIIPKFIEKVAKDVKGSDYDINDVLYECDASAEDFDLKDRRIVDIINNLPGRIILSTEYEHQKGEGWANFKYVLENLGINPDKVVFQAGNHDGDGVPNCADNPQVVEDQTGAMMRSHDESDWTQFKDGPDHLYKYSRGRHGEVDKAKNRAILVNDFIGTKAKIDYHNKNHELDYKIRFTENWEQEHQDNVSKGIAYTTDARIFRAEHDGSRAKNPELYDRLEKYAAWERRQDANAVGMDTIENDLMGQVDIESIPLEVLKNGSTEDILQAAGLI